MLGDMTWFNVHHGFLEAMCKGLRKSFLNEHDYQNMKDCKKLDDLKLNLQETDYGDVFEEIDANKIASKVVMHQCEAKLAKELQYMRAHAVDPLDKFIDFIMYEYQIQTVVALLKATTKGYEPNSAEINDVLESCHPLGRFDPSVMRSITAFDSSADGLEELYAAVLIEVPVGKYFSQFLADEAEKASVAGVEEARSRLAEMPLATLENSIMRLYLEDFYDFCVNLGGETAEQMGQILRARADMITINITYNSLRTVYNNSSERESSRKALYPSFGTLYPEGTIELAKADSESAILAVLQRHIEYASLWESAPVRAVEDDYYYGEEEDEESGSAAAAGRYGGAFGGAAQTNEGERDISQAFFERTVGLLENAFDGQFHFGLFYAYVKLKEQEAKNIAWVTTCIRVQKRDFDRLVPIFSGA